MDTREYVSNARQSREEDARRMLDALEAGEEFEGQDADEALDELPLSVEVVRHVVIVLSTGGPHEEIDAVVDGDTMMRAHFRAGWGSDSRETRLTPNDALWTLAERYVSMVVDQ